MAFELLFSPMKIGGVEIKNRVVMAPMLMGFANVNGTPTKELLDYYEERAKGSAGLIITEITRVNDVNGAAAFAQLGMSKDYQIKPMKELADRVHKHGAKLFVQLHHPGRQNMGLLIGTVPMSVFFDRITPLYKKLLYKVVPSGKALMEKHLVPKVVAPSKCENSYFADSNNRALSKREIKKLIEQFSDAALRVKRSGADGVELHASHGYLIQQFLSPNTNHRMDEYGGSIENRMRFLLDIIRETKRKCGKDFPIIVRLTVDECYDKIGKPGKGYSLDEGVCMAKRLEKAGVAAIDVSSAAYDTFNYWLEPTTFECGWRAYMAKAVKQAVTIPVIAANLIRSPEQAERQIAEGYQDFVSLGRPHIADPHWAQKTESGHAEDIKRCICCLYCIESMQNNAYTGGHGNCAVNPFVGRETEYLKKDGNGKTVAIIGAGPAGLMSAELAAGRGFKVVVLEKNDAPGGQINYASAPPDKEKIHWCVEDMYNSCVKAGVEFRFGVSATEELLKELEPYAVIVATGGAAVRPRSIAGADKPNVYTPEQILSGDIKLLGSTVAVIGSGMTGLETAEFLAQNNGVFIVEMADNVAPGTWMQHVDDIMPKLKSLGVEIYTSQKLLEITDSGIVTESADSRKKRTVTDCDAVVLALGVRSENALYQSIKDKFERVLLVGDAAKSGRIADATESAYLAVTQIESDCAVLAESFT